jgi:hypothetical protein
MKLLAALGAAVCVALPAVAGAQNGYPSYAVASQQSIKGTITGFNGQYAVFVQDEKGYTDNVQMHDGTVINPTGIRLQEGMKVTIYGYPNGSVFQAYRIDTQYPANYGYQGGYGYGGYPNGGYAYGGYPNGGYGYGGDPYGGYPYGGYPYGGYGYGYPYGGYGYGGWAPYWGLGIGWWGGWWGWPGYACCINTPIFFRGPIIVRRGPFHGIVHGPITGPVRGGTIHGGMGAPITRGGVGAPPVRGGFGAPVHGGFGAPVRGGMGAPVHGGGPGPGHSGPIRGGRP